MAGTAAAQGSVRHRRADQLRPRRRRQSRTDAERFSGGQIRARVSPRTAFELSLDLRTETDDAKTVRVRSIPIQASLLLYPGPRRVFAVRPRRRWLVLAAGRDLAGDETVTVRERPVNSAGTRDSAPSCGSARTPACTGTTATRSWTWRRRRGRGGRGGRPADRTRFLPDYRGSMWTAGLTSISSR